MKKFLVGTIMCLILSPNSFTQNMIKGIGNLDFQSISGDGDFFTDWQIGIEYLVTDNISIGGSLGFIINEGLAYVLDTDIKYYSGEDFSGWGVGGFAGFALDSYAFYLRLGFEGLYSYKVSESFVIQPQVRLGYGYVNAGYDVYLNSIDGGGILFSPGAMLCYTF
jgi:hypothetical protein